MLVHLLRKYKYSESQIEKRRYISKPSIFRLKAFRQYLQIWERSGRLQRLLSFQIYIIIHVFQNYNILNICIDFHYCNHTILALRTIYWKQFTSAATTLPSESLAASIDRLFNLLMDAERKYQKHRRAIQLLANL